MANIGLNTTIENLLDMGLISVRSFHCCLLNNILTVDQIIYYKNNNGSFLSMRNCGRKSEQELNNIVYYMNGNFDQDKSITESLDSNCIDAIDIDHYRFSLASEYFAKRFPTSSDFATFLYDKSSDITFPDLLGDSNRNKNFRQGILSCISNLLTNKNLNGHYYEILNSKKATLENAVDELYRREFYRENITEKKLDYLCKRYDTILTESVPIRCQNAIRILYNGFEEFKELLFNQKSKDFRMISHIGRKSLRDLEDFIKKIEGEISQVIRMSDEDIDKYILKANLPFLDEYCIDFVNSFYNEKGYYPLFYLLQQYIVKSDTNSDIAFSLYYGCNGQRETDFRNIADKMGLSRERVRQIIVKGTTIENEFIASSDRSHYEILNNNCIFADEYEIKEIIEDEKINGGNTCILALCTTIADYKFIDLGNYSIAASNKMLKIVNPDKIGSFIGHKIQEKRFADEIVSIEQLVKDFDAEAYNSETYRLIETIAKYTFNINISNDCLRFEVNAYNMSDIIYNILKEKEEPLTSDEIWVLLKDKYPTEVKAKNNDSVVRAIVNDNRFTYNRSLMKYSLEEWGNELMTLREYMIHFLLFKDTPQHVSTILDEIKKYYPNYIDRNVIATAGLGDEDFIRFTDGYIGLRGKNYSEEFVEVTPDMIIRRPGFEKNFEDFKNFIIEHGHFPVSGEDEFQDSLVRWSKNVETNVLSITDEQVNRYNEFVSQYQDIPHTKVEYVCYNMCKRLSEYIENDNFPSHKEDEKFYRWFYNHIVRRKTYNDRQDLYISEVIAKYPKLAKNN